MTSVLLFGGSTGSSIRPRLRLRCCTAPSSSSLALELIKYQDLSACFDLNTAIGSSRRLRQQKSYVKQLPCADCRGRGYCRCKECDISNPRGSCAQCAGKGVMLCRQCQDGIVEGKSVMANNLSWEKLQSESSIRIKDDEAIENMIIPEKTSPRKRVYGPVSAATRAKISHALKELERRTGAFSSRIRNEDPVLHAQRVSAIQRAKRTEESRKNISSKLISYFMNPENRLQRSLSMKGMSMTVAKTYCCGNAGVKYCCKSCGVQGHRKSFCSSSAEWSSRVRSRCSFCRAVGHRVTNCPHKAKRCSNCNTSDHSTQTCPQMKLINKLVSKRVARKCGVCKQEGHDRRTCPSLAS